jgi:hypothetical protein
MKTLLSLTARCRVLVEGSEIAAHPKSIIAGRLGEIEKLLEQDVFRATRCSFLALPRFQNILHDAELLQFDPSAKAVSDLVHGSDAIIAFIQDN